MNPADFEGASDHIIRERREGKERFPVQRPPERRTVDEIGEAWEIFSALLAHPRLPAMAVETQEYIEEMHAVLAWAMGRPEGASFAEHVAELGKLLREVNGKEIDFAP